MNGMLSQSCSIAQPITARMRSRSAWSSGTPEGLDSAPTSPLVSMKGMRPASRHAGCTVHVMFIPEFTHDSVDALHDLTVRAHDQQHFAKIDDRHPDRHQSQPQCQLRQHGAVGMDHA